MHYLLIYTFVLQSPQEEVGQTVLKDGTIEKSVRATVLGKVEWYEEVGDGCAVLPVRVNFIYIYL